MAMRLRPLHVVSFLLLAAMSVVGFWTWSTFRTEPLPEELAPVKEDPTTLVIEGLENQPDLDLSALESGTTFFVMVGPMADDKSKEGQTINRALNRWELPDTTRGYIVVDLPGLGWLSGQAERFYDRFSAESRYPIYLDFKGAFRTHFNLPKGHYGLVILNERGEIVHRSSGNLDEEALARVGRQLGAQEPAPGPAAPEFTAGPLSRDACEQKSCVLLFVGRRVEPADLPKAEASLGPSLGEHWAKLQDPAIRLLLLAMRAPLDDAPSARGVLIGDVPELHEDLRGWSRVQRDDDARAAFGLAPDANAIIVIDPQGRVALRQEGFLPLFLWGRIADVLGVEIDFDFDDE